MLFNPPTQFRHNTIQVALIPNFQYTQLEAALAEDPSFNTTVEISPQNIKKLEIFKSYDTHLTDVTLHLVDLDQITAIRISEGKYIIYIYAANATLQDGGIGQLNYFLCHEVTFPGGYPIATSQRSDLVINLRSIVRTRLELENNFAFELGGKGAKAASAGTQPIGFFLGDFAKLYTTNFAKVNPLEEFNSNLFDFTMSDFSQDSVHITNSIPSSGYKMEVDTNLEAIDYFFKNYPMFKTKFGWILDDFNIGGINPTVLKVTDFTMYPAWKNRISQGLSNFFNNELDVNDPVSQDFATMAISELFSIKPIEKVTYFDWAEFIIQEKFPKIYAVDIFTGQEIPMTSWNSVHEERLVLVSDGAGIKLKKIKNPRRSEYLTFMNEREIMETQLYKTVFKYLHPEITTYEFKNALVGDIDLNTAIHFKKEALAEGGYNKDRFGICYQVYHKFEQVPQREYGHYGETMAQDRDRYDSQFSPRFSLETVFSILSVDEGNLDISLPGEEDRATYETEVDSYDDPELAGLDCYPGSDGTYGDGGGLPGNTNIGDQAESYVKAGFKYVWGGTSDKGMDCSAFVQKAVTAAGIRGFPRTTLTQYPWCKAHAKSVSVENMQRGDIIFFAISKSHPPVSHVGIAANNAEFYHATRPYGTKRSLKGYFKPVGIYRIPQPNRSPDPKLAQSN